MNDWKVHEFSKEIDLFQHMKAAGRSTTLQLQLFLQWWWGWKYYLKGTECSLRTLYATTIPKKRNLNNLYRIYQCMQFLQ